MRRYNLFSVLVALSSKDCPDHCNHCSSTSVCTECKSSYLMYQFECFDPCPNATFASTTTTCEGTLLSRLHLTMIKDCPIHCNHCTSTSLCTECIGPFVLYDSQCQTSCPNAMFDSNNICKGRKIVSAFHLTISKIVQLVVLLVLLKTLAKSALKDIL